MGSNHHCISLALLALSSLSACIEVPAAPPEQSGLLADAGLELGAALDGGARRPATGDRYLGPQCDPSEPAGGVVIAGDGGSGLPGASERDRGAEPGAAAGSAAVTGGSAAMPPVGAAGSAPVARRAGQLVVSELMSNPAALRDDDGEWVELYNPSADAPVSLDGCAFDDGSAMRALMPGLTVLPLEALAFARSAQVGFVPAQLISISLANAADSLALVCNGTVIDRVSYGAGFPLVAGASMSLDPAALDAIANDVPSAWCAGRTPDALGERGTPGEPNPPCDREDAGMP